MIKCVIIEDEPQAVLLIKNMIKQLFPNICVIANFDKISTSVDFIKSEKPHFIFLDVQLNGEIGIDIANYFSKNDFIFDIIFTTSHSIYAIEAFNLSAIDYLLKPLNEARFIEAVNRVIKKQQISHEQLEVLHNSSHQQKIDKIVLSMNEKKIIVKVSDIIFLKADNVYTEFYLTNNTKYIVSKPLKEYELLLSQNIFYKPHRSYIINTNAIKSYQKSSAEIEMNNDIRVNLSRDKKKEFEDIYLK